MRVLHINKTDAGGGAAVAALRIHRSLLRAGVDNHFLVQEKKRTEINEHTIGNGALYNARSFANFCIERLLLLPNERSRSLRYYFSTARTGRSIADLPQVREADILHLHWINQGFISMKGLEELFKLGKPIVWTLHDMWPFTGGCHYAGTCYEFDDKCCYCPFLRVPKKEDVSSYVFKRKKEIFHQGKLSVVTCSRWLGTMAKSSALMRTMPVYTIPNPIDVNFYRMMDKMECRRELGLPLDKKLLLFGAANVTDIRKGFRYLEEALRITQDSFPLLASQVELIIFGKLEPTWVNKFKFKMHQMNFISDPSMLVKLYNAADTFVLPSLQDNLPNTVVESLACGTPVVGFSTGGIPEMVRHNKTGYLAEIRNSLSLSNGIYTTLFFTEENRKLARESAIEMFSEPNVAQQYIKVYEDSLR